MSPKKKLLKTMRVNCLMQLLIEDLDDFDVVGPEANKFKEDMIGFIELMSNKQKDTALIQRSTYFQELTNKLDTVIRKSFESYGK